MALNFKSLSGMKSIALVIDRQEHWVSVAENIESIA